MKKLILCFVIALSFKAYVNAQSLSVANVTDTIYGDANAPSPGLQAHFDVINNSSNTLSILLQRYELSMVTGATSNFCWGPLCYGSATSLSPNPAVINPGADEPSFYGDYQANGTPGISTIAYTFFDENNTSDSIQVRLTFNATVTGINNITNTNFISKPQPNPASAFTAIKYSLVDNNKGKVKVFDMLGNTVKEFNISSRNGTIILPVSDLKSGIYFTSLLVDNKIVSNQKLIVIK